MLTLTKSSSANPNYLAKIVAISNIRKHSKADRLQCFMVDGNNVIVGLEEKDGDIGVYFPIECQINLDWLKANNLLRDKELNADKTKAGFFEINGRVKALKLRDEKSEGFWVPAYYLSTFFKTNLGDFVSHLNEEFDTINDQLLVKKYIIQYANQIGEPRPPKDKKDIVKKKNLLVEGQFNFHIDTCQLGKNIHKVLPDSHITITKKMHGTSCISSNLLIKRKLSWFEKIARFFGAKIVESEYGNIYASRRVIKNIGKQDPGNSYYSENIYGKTNDKVFPCLKSEMTVYYEIVGHLSNGGHIQKGYDYGCGPTEHEIYVYRITTTTSTGQVFDWPWLQTKAWCAHVGLKHVPELWSGKAEELLPSSDLEKDFEFDENLQKEFIEIDPETKFGSISDQRSDHLFYKGWHELLLMKLKEVFLEKKDSMCKNDVWDEGIVLRIDSLEFDVYKLKSFNFLNAESKALDKGEVDMESIQVEEV